MRNFLRPAASLSRRYSTLTLSWADIQVWFQGNFNRRGAAGCQVEVLPFLRVFPPARFGGYGRKNWTVHFGWLFWTVGIHTYHREM